MVQGQSEEDRYLLFPNFSVNFLFYWHKYSKNSSTRNWDTRNRSSEPGTVASLLIITSQFSSFFNISLKNSLWAARTTLWHIKSRSLHLHVMSPGIPTSVSLEIDLGRAVFARYSLPLLPILISFSWKWFYTTFCLLDNLWLQGFQEIFAFFLIGSFGTPNWGNSDLQSSAKQ